MLMHSQDLPVTGTTVERRSHPRVDFEAPVTVVAVEANGQIEPRQLPARTLDLSPSGAVIVVVEELEAHRIWLRLPDAAGTICECEIVRAAALPDDAAPTAFAYGVRFAACWGDVDFQDLLASMGAPAAP